MEQVCFSTKNTTLEKIDKEAKRLNQSRSSLINGIVEKYLGVGGEWLNQNKDNT